MTNTEIHAELRRIAAEAYENAYNHAKSCETCQNDDECAEVEVSRNIGHEIEICAENVEVMTK